VRQVHPRAGADLDRRALGAADEAPSLTSQPRLLSLLVNPVVHPCAQRTRNKPHQLLLFMVDLIRRCKTAEKVRSNPPAPVRGRDRADNDSDAQSRHSREPFATAPAWPAQSPLWKGDPTPARGTPAPARRPWFRPATPISPRRGYRNAPDARPMQDHCWSPSRSSARRDRATARPQERKWRRDRSLLDPFAASGTRELVVCICAQRCSTFLTEHVSVRGRNGSEPG